MVSNYPEEGEEEGVCEGEINLQQRLAVPGGLRGVSQNLGSRCTAAVAAE